MIVPSSDGEGDESGTVIAPGCPPSRDRTSTIALSIFFEIDGGTLVDSVGDDSGNGPVRHARHVRIECSARTG